MSNDAQNHPTSGTLEQFSLGHLAGSEAASLEAHLTACGACCDTLSQLDSASDAFVAQLRALHTTRREPADMVPPGGTRQHAGAPTGVVDPYSTIFGLGKEKTEPLVPGLPPLQPASPKVDGTFGQYDQLELLAQGGMGVVYKARQPSLNRIVALKMIRNDMLGTDEAVKRFYLEARAAAALDHPNIVPIFEIDEHRGYHYYTMAYIPGIRLRDVVAKGQLPPRQAVELLLPVIDAVAYAHERGIIHRDLKPDNVLIDAQNRPRVTDFGLAKQEGDAALTATGAVLGTPSYMAPEQALGKKTGPATDIYALGGILYFLLTCRPPFIAASVTQVISQLLHEPPQPLRSVNPNVPEALSLICARCLAKEPEQRYASAAALKEALVAFLTNGSVPSVATPADVERRSRGFIFGLAACGILVLAIGAWLVMRERPTDGSAPPSTGSPTTGSPAAFDWPPVAHKDFPLTVEMVGGRPGADGIIEVDEDQAISLRITPARDAHVGVWSLDADGALTQLFPNEHETGLVKATETRTLPGPGLAYTITATPSVTAGNDRLRVIASTRPWSAPEGRKHGPFRVLGDLDKNKLASTVRGLKIDSGNSAQDGVAETEVLFRVRERK
jgi:serine/threonine protein kinase